MVSSAHMVHQQFYCILSSPENTSWARFPFPKSLFASFRDQFVSLQHGSFNFNTVLAVNEFKGQVTFLGITSWNTSQASHRELGNPNEEVLLTKAQFIWHPPPSLWQVEDSLQVSCGRARSPSNWLHQSASWRVCSLFCTSLGNCGIWLFTSSTHLNSSLSLTHSLHCGLWNGPIPYLEVLLRTWKMMYR